MPGDTRYGTPSVLDRAYHAHQFNFSFSFTFFVRSVWWTKLATRQLFTAR